MSQKTSHSNLSRRTFLSSAAAVSAFSVVPRHVLGGAGNKAPSDKLNIAGVGIGGKGYSDLTSVKSENIVALCDVDWRHAANAAKTFPKARQWQDFRKMLDEQKDIDAVITATPDHLHAVVSMEAIKRGKHIYTQKPLTHTVYEARALAEAAQKYNVASQMGNQGQAGEETRRLREMIWDGAIGPVREVHVWTDRPNRGFTDVYWPQGVGRPTDIPPVPEGLDWDLFLGPAPVRPYHPAYHPFRWRGWWDFGTGALGDIGCHSLDPIFRALQLGYPLTVQAVSTLVNNETYPSGSIVKYEFPARVDMPAVTLTWYDGGMKPFRPDELEDGRQLGTNGTLYIGDKGKILDGLIIPESKRKEYKTPPKSIPSSPGHYEEWLNACKGGRPAGSNFSFAGPLTEVVLLGNIALRLELKEKVSRLKLQWDPKNLKITNLPEANQFLHVEYRKGWTL
ncbi:MAG: Gfo/Idh/MocA family oxidoreductase [Sedimentisphaerales bacterium]|nr:Gfo/Idh/MocA family oxidoreductase [Sedimentisphaerales bacterium]